VSDSPIDLAGLAVGAEDFLAVVLETMAQPVWLVDSEDVIRFASPAAASALGYDGADELLGRRSRDTIRPATGEPERLVRRDGSTFPVSLVSAPIELEDGRGAVVAFTDVGERLRAERDAALAVQLGSLRRVAALVAGGAASPDVFAAIAREVAHVLGLELVAMWRYESDDTATVLGAWSDRPHPLLPGTRWPLDGPALSTQVKQTGRPARIDDFGQVSGTIAAAVRDVGIRSGAGAPIVVDGQVWGAIATYRPQALPDHIEDRLVEFTSLVAAAFSNTASRDELARLADEQAALRRVATLVARGVSSSELFGAVTEEVGGLLGADLAGMVRYVTDEALTAVATWAAEGVHPEVRGVWPLEGDRLATTILRTGRPAREDGWEEVAGPIADFVRRELGIRSSVGSPIVVEGRVWGALFVHSKTARALPVDTESRMADFTELVNTAMSNAQARADVSRLADEQAALRRVATLVARASAPAEVFAAVAEEVGRLLGVDDTTIFRYEDDWAATVMADRGERDIPLPVGTQVPLEGDSATALVRQTGRAARIDDFSNASGPLADYTRDAGIGSTVGSPIVVDGRLWGAMIAATRTDEPMPPDTELRMGEFTALVGTAISNAQAQTDLAASRARIVAATDEERRRVVRDLHDGAQQRLVQTVLTLKLAVRALEEDGHGPELVAEALEQAERAMVEVRELAHGIIPSVLTHGGLRAGVDALASRMPVPVDVSVAAGRLPIAVEATAYFVVAESLTNVAKHARAERATVTVRVEDAALRIRVRDDGVGGARSGGTGLVGLADRLAALDGRLSVDSPPGAGTLVAADIPLPG
jgi:signal transduction histidine kinase